MKMCAQDIEFTLIRSDRKTADIVIERSGDVIVRAPAGLDDEQVRAAVADRASWVHRSLAEWEDLNFSRRHRPLVQGQGFAYLGRSYRLRFVADADVPLCLKNGRWELSEAFVVREGEPAARKAFRDFYIAKGRRIFTERVQSLAPLVGVTPGEVAVKELGYHWASCGAGGALNFHWKTLMAPPNRRRLHRRARTLPPSPPRSFGRLLERGGQGVAAIPGAKGMAEGERGCTGFVGTEQSRSSGKYRSKHWADFALLILG